MDRPHRQLRFVRGRREETALAAASVVDRLAAEDVAWVGPYAPAHRKGWSRAELAGALGGTLGAVVLSLHEGLRPDDLGRAQGLVRAGGALVLRLPADDALPPADRARRQVPPWGPEAVGDRTWRRVLSRLPRSGGSAPLAAPPPVAPHADELAEQDAVVEALLGTWAGPPGLAVVTARRGRGKSAALGRALAGLTPDLRDHAVICGPSEAASAVVRRFAGAPPVPRRHPLDLLDAEPSPRILVVDEAAQLPVPLLRTLLAAHPQAHLAFATTVEGYEGTGRGFLLRFLEDLRRDPRPLQELRLARPLRWAPGDPLEAWVDDTLCLDAAPPVLATAPASTPRHALLDREALARDEPLLRGVFGLLSHAHYRTTPADLQRLLDAPGLAVHALFEGEEPVAVGLVAAEGALPEALLDDMLAGRTRVRGQALADTLACHAGRPGLARGRLWRSVRTAVHPARRRQGLGRQLVEAEHRTHPDGLWGTLFGATPGLLRFRLGLGYRVVRLGHARSDRAGEPSVVMLRPRTPEEAAEVALLQQTLATELPLSVALLRSEGPVSDEMIDLIRGGLPPPGRLSLEEEEAAVAAWLRGVRPLEGAATALRQALDAGRLDPGHLDPVARMLLLGRLERHRPWRTLANEAGLPSVPAAMRCLRRAVASSWSGGSAGSGLP